MYALIRNFVEDSLFGQGTLAAVQERFDLTAPENLERWKVLHGFVRNVIHEARTVRKNGGFIVCQPLRTVLHIANPHSGMLPHTRTYHRGPKEHPLCAPVLVLCAIAGVPVIDARDVFPHHLVNAPLWGTVSAQRVVAHLVKHGALVHRYHETPALSEISIRAWNRQDHSELHISTPLGAYVYLIDSFTLPSDRNGNWYTRVQRRDLSFSADFVGRRAYDNESACIREALLDVLLCEKWLNRSMA